MRKHSLAFTVYSIFIYFCCFFFFFLLLFCLVLSCHQPTKQPANQHHISPLQTGTYTKCILSDEEHTHSDVCAAHKCLEQFRNKYICDMLVCAASVRGGLARYVLYQHCNVLVILQFFLPFFFCSVCCHEFGSFKFVLCKNAQCAERTNQTIVACCWLSSGESCNSFACIADDGRRRHRRSRCRRRVPSKCAKAQALKFFLCVSVCVCVAILCIQFCFVFIQFMSPVHLCESWLRVQVQSECGVDVPVYAVLQLFTILPLYGSSTRSANCTGRATIRKLCKLCRGKHAFCSFLCPHCTQHSHVPSALSFQRTHTHTHTPSSSHHFHSTTLAQRNFLVVVVVLLLSFSFFILFFAWNQRKMSAACNRKQKLYI